MATAITDASSWLPAIRPSPSGGQAIIAAGTNGWIAGHLNVVSTTTDGELSTCELRIANETSFPASYQLSIVQDGKSSALSLDPLMLPPASAIATTVNVRRLPGTSPQRLVAHINGAQAAFTVEAPLPTPPRRTRRVRPWAIAGSLFGIAAVLEGGAFAYRAIASMQRPVAIAQPLSVAPKPRTIVRVVHPARVVALSVDSQQVPGGGVVTAHYEAIGESGTVKLNDEAGTTWSQEPLRSNGLAHLRVPDVSRDQAMRVVLTVNHAGTTATSNVGVMISAGAAAASAGFAEPAGAEPAAAPVAPPKTARLRDPEGIMALSKNRFPSGFPITVRIVKHEDHLRIALQHADGSEVSAVEVAPSDRTVTLPAPDVGSGETYNILASYLRGISEQISVIPITIYPR